MSSVFPNLPSNSKANNFGTSLSRGWCFLDKAIQLGFPEVPPSGINTVPVEEGDEGRQGRTGNRKFEQTFHTMTVCISLGMMQVGYGLVPH